MRRLIAACLLLTCGLHSQAARLDIRTEPANHAWWLRATLTPDSRTLFGLPLAHFNPRWCAADFWEPSLLPRDALVEAFVGTDLAFSQTWHAHGLPSLLAKVGVYRRCDGKTGSFVALLDLRGPRTRVRHVEEIEPAAFTALALSRNNALEIWWCSECDDFLEMSWDVGRQKFVFRALDHMPDD